MLVRSAAFSLLLASLVSYPATAQRQQGQEPELNVEAVVEAGEALYSQFNYSATPTARLVRSLRIGYTKPVHLGPDDVLVDAQARRGQRFCTVDVVYEGSLGAKSDRLCLIDKDGDGAFDRVEGMEFGAARKKFYKGQKPDYEDGPSLIKTGFRRELIYSGVGDKTLRLSYREFSGSLARPAFTQELTFTLEDDGTATVSFRGARIQIHEAGNFGIRYSVLQGMQK